MLKTTNEVNVVLTQMSMKELKELSRCITFLGHDVVNVY